MKAVVTVVGKDKTGIIASVTAYLSKLGVNVEDISQTIMQEWFAMIMLVETGDVSISQLRDGAVKLGKKEGINISVQHEDIFTAMHRI